MVFKVKSKDLKYCSSPCTFHARTEWRLLAREPKMNAPSRPNSQRTFISSSLSLSFSSCPQYNPVLSASHVWHNKPIELRTLLFVLLSFHAVNTRQSLPLLFPQHFRIEFTRISLLSPTHTFVGTERERGGGGGGQSESYQCVLFTVK